MDCPQNTCEETGGCLKTWDGEEEDTIKRKTLAWHVNVLMLSIQKKVRGVRLGAGVEPAVVCTTIKGLSLDKLVDSPY